VGDDDEKEGLLKSKHRREKFFVDLKTINDVKDVLNRPKRSENSLRSHENIQDDTNS
jgi:hypothetical protein